MARRGEQPEVGVVLVRAVEGVVAAHAVGGQQHPDDRAFLGLGFYRHAFIFTQ